MPPMRGIEPCSISCGEQPAGDLLRNIRTPMAVCSAMTSRRGGERGRDRVASCGGWGRQKISDVECWEIDDRTY